MLCRASLMPSPAATGTGISAERVRRTRQRPALGYPPNATAATYAPWQSDRILVAFRSPFDGIRPLHRGKLRSKGIEKVPQSVRPAIEESFLSSGSEHKRQPTGQVTVAKIKSQIKRNRQNEKRRLRNKSMRSEMHTRAKSALAAAVADDEDAEEKLRSAIKRIDKAAAKGVIHKNTAARRKSRLIAQTRKIAADG